MKVKITGTLPATASESLSLHAPTMYAALGTRRIAIVEIAGVERTEIADDEDKAPVLTLQIKAMEVAEQGDTEDAVRRAMDALYTLRTATGTLTEDGDLEMTQSTIDGVAGNVAMLEAARLHAAVGKWADYIRDLRWKSMTHEQTRDELRKIADGLTTARFPDTLVTT